MKVRYNNNIGLVSLVYLLWKDHVLSCEDLEVLMWCFSFDVAKRITLGENITYTKLDN